MARRRSYKSKVKRKISKITGIPTTRSGRNAKIGRIVTGGGCLLPIVSICCICALVLTACNSSNTSVEDNSTDITIIQDTTKNNNENNQETSTQEETTFETQEDITTKVSNTTFQETTVETSQTTEKESSNENTHTITIPSSWINDLDATISSAEQDEDIISYTVNDDGSITYVYTEEKYQGLLEETKQTVYDSINETLQNTEEFPSITNIIINNDDMTDVSLYVNKEDYEQGWDSFYVLGLYMQCGMYNMLVDNSENEFLMTVHLIDNETNQEYDSYTYPNKDNENEVIE